jgi:3-deoxy-D-manno-octulosonate 8-phosphate phosphatase KdsC-like HAD superfamily phosphatase
MAVVGWPVAVADARPEVKAQARLVLSREGGNGAVREICDRILAARQGEVASSTAAAQTPVVTG